MQMVIERRTEFADMADNSLYRRVTTQLWAIVAILMLIVGASAIYFSSTDRTAAWSAFGVNVGGVLVATGLISLVWELTSKRSFLSEIFSVAELSEDVLRSGLHRLTTNFQHDVEWPKLLGSARSIDIFFSYGRTWRNANLSLLREFASRTESQMTLILPDPESAEVMSELARRYSATADAMKDRINETIKEFIALFDKQKGAKGQLKIFLTTTTPVFTFYRIDKKYVLATYRHRREKGDVPTLICDRNGEITNFIDLEYEYLTSESMHASRKIFPAPKDVRSDGNRAIGHPPQPEH
jgi:hypothetical protein